MDKIILSIYQNKYFHHNHCFIIHVTLFLWIELLNSRLYENQQWK